MLTLDCKKQLIATVLCNSCVLLKKFPFKTPQLIVIYIHTVRVIQYRQCTTMGI